jgi:N-acetylglucosaminyl-diphospho-decaprenol L-rhamnosyltransferase
LKLQIIIVNYRTPRLVVDCLRSLTPQVVEVQPAAQVLVVEGGSGDDSAAVIAQAIARDGWRDWVKLLVSQENRGFAGGNNVALRQALLGPQVADYLWLLNPDTVVRPGGLRELVGFMDAHPRSGVAGSRLEDPDGSVQCSAFRFPSLLSELEAAIRLRPVTWTLRRWMIAPPPPEAAQPADWVSGASFLIRTQALRQVGLLDEQYFMYFEELDFCRRLALAGWERWYVPASGVVHLGGQSTGVRNGWRPSKRTPRYWFESRRRYLLKHHGWAYTLAADVTWSVGRGLWCLGRLLRRKEPIDAPWHWWDFVRFNLLPLSRDGNAS